MPWIAKRELPSKDSHSSLLTEHVGSQTVTRKQNEHYYDPIKEFMNSPCTHHIPQQLLNLGGEPLVETLDDAVRTLYNSEMEYCYSS